MGSQGNIRSIVTERGTDDLLRETFVRMGRTCGKEPRAIGAAKYLEAAQWRTMMRTFRDVLDASNGRALPDVLAFVGEMARTVIVMAGAEPSRCLTTTLREEAVVDAKNDALEIEVALNPNLANVEALIEHTRAMERATYAKLQALLQTRDALMDRNSRRAA